MRKSDSISQGLEQIEQELRRIASKSTGLFTAEMQHVFSLIDEMQERVEPKKSSVKEGSRIYQQIFEKAPIGIMHFNKLGIIDACNEMFMNIFDTSWESLDGLSIYRIENKEVKHSMIETLEGKSSHFEGPYTAITSGKKLPIRAVFHPDYGSDGSLEGGFVMLEDITDRYEAEKKLVESEERYRTIFEQNESVMLLIDVNDGSIFDANSTALNFYGWSKQEITNMKISDINTLPPEEVKKEMEKARRKNRNLFHFKHRLANGEVRDVEVYSGMIYIDSKYYLYSIVHDISERIKAQKDLMKFKLGIENSSNMVLITNYDGEIEYTNKAFLEKYGFSFKEIEGRTPRILKSGKYSTAFYEKYWQTLLNKKVMKGEMINKTKDGEELYISYSTNPIVDKQGNLNGFIAIQDDITEEKKAEQKLSNSLREKEVLLSEIHHRVKNNLAIVSALLELNIYQEEEISVEELVHSSQLRIKAIAEVHEMLYQTEQFTHISFKEYVERLVRKIRETVQNREQKITFKTDVEDIKLNINQAIPIGLVVYELLMNSIKYSFSGKDNGQIEIGLKREEGEVFITVKDDGKADPRKRKGSEGSLGQTLLQVLIQQIKGSLDVNRTDQGNVFRLKFTPSEKRGSAGNMI